MMTHPAVFMCKGLLWPGFVAAESGLEPGPLDEQQMQGCSLMGVTQTEEPVELMIKEE